MPHFAESSHRKSSLREDTLKTIARRGATKRAWRSLLIFTLLNVLTAASQEIAAVQGTEVHLSPGPEPIPVTLFGMHIHRAASSTPWPPVAFASQRLWDVGLTWRDLEPQQGKWQWESMDRAVQLDEQHGTGVLLDLAMTPDWAASRPAEDSPYGKGAASPPVSPAEWQRHVSSVATRYRGRVHEYELWNEPNFTTFYTGTSQQLVQLARTGYAAIKEADKTAVIASPAFSLEDEGGYRGLEAFLAAGGGAYADVIAVHLYVGTGSPEDQVGRVTRLKQMLARYHLEAKPIWNTEMGWPKQKVFHNREEAAGYVARTYLLDWALGIQRVYWYAWDNTVWVSLVMVEKDEKTTTLAAEAYGRVQQWMVGWQMHWCERGPGSVWICELTRGSSRAHIVWADSPVAEWAIPRDWRAKTVEELTGKSRPLTGSALAVGAEPVRIE